MNVCFLVPHFEHAGLLPGVVAGLEAYDLPMLVVDDGSSAATRDRLAELAASHPRLEIVYRDTNGGKGAALKSGYRRARELGFTHALQVDADQQHDLTDVPKFLGAMRATPGALILGVPVFDESVPKSRLYGRQISVAMVRLLTLSGDIPDPLCGFRGVPLASALHVIDGADTGDRMDFDPEFAVRMLWQGTPLGHIRTRVSYDPDNHVSHFHMIADNVLLTRMYTRMTFGMLRRLPSLASRRAGSAIAQAESRRP